MRMKIGDAHNLYSALNRINNDQSLKLKDSVLLAMVINENRLLPFAQAYEKVRQAAFVEIRKEGLNDHGVYVKDGAMFDATFGQRDVVLREEEKDLPDLEMIKFDDLKPVKGEHFIANKIWLRPMIEDFPG